MARRLRAGKNAPHDSPSPLYYSEMQTYESGIPISNTIPKDTYGSEETHKVCKLRAYQYKVLLIIYNIQIILKFHCQSNAIAVLIIL